MTKKMMFYSIWLLEISSSQNSSFHFIIVFKGVRLHIYIIDKWNKDLDASNHVPPVLFEPISTARTSANESYNPRQLELPQGNWNCP
nr:hypothetical protein [Tanacetum cinerariifolium]